MIVVSRKHIISVKYEENEEEHKEEIELSDWEMNNCVLIEVIAERLPHLKIIDYNYEYEIIRHYKNGKVVMVEKHFV